MAPDEEELDASWIVAFDEKGNDLALEAQLAAMTPEERKRTDENFRAFIEELKSNIRPRSTSASEAISTLGR